MIVHLFSKTNPAHLGGVHHFEARLSFFLGERTTLGPAASPDKLHWRTSARGNPFALADGFHVVVFRRQSGEWAVRIEEIETGRDWYPAGRFADQNEARAGAFHALQQILSGDHSVPAGNWVAGRAQS